MNKKYILALLISLGIMTITRLVVWSQTNSAMENKGNEVPTDTLPKIAIAYVEDFRKDPPDPFMFTHLIYSFVKFNNTNDSAILRHPEKLQELVDLKKKNPELKVMVSIGGGGGKKEGFSEMTRDKNKRESFVASIKHLVDSFYLDGVDLDWEFPTTTKGGHTASPEDDINYAVFAKELRKALGKDKLISYYSLPGGNFINHERMLPYVDYVNVSGYNLEMPKEGEPLYHHSPLYASTKTGKWCIQRSIEIHIKLGVPKEKILLGIPFFGRGKSPFPKYVSCYDIAKYSGTLKPKWSEEAQAPYYEDEKGNFIFGYDDERSIKAKFDFIRANDMPGVFVWNYDTDFDDHRLGKTIQRLRK